MYIINNKKSLSLFIIMLFVCVTFLGTFQFHKSISNAVSLIKTAVAYPTIAILEVNDFIKNIASEDDPEGNKAGAVPVNREKRDNMILKLLFFMMSAALISNEKILLMLLVTVLINICKGFKKTFYEKDRILKPPDIKYYQRWRLQFITPIEKCIQYLADKYDINPMFYGWAEHALRINPHFVIKHRVRVFFMEK